jgi:hypothetical protein
MTHILAGSGACSCGEGGELPSLSDEEDTWPSSDWKMFMNAAEGPCAEAEEAAGDAEVCGASILRDIAVRVAAMFSRQGRCSIWPVIGGWRRANRAYWIAGATPRPPRKDFVENEGEKRRDRRRKEGR